MEPNPPGAHLSSSSLLPLHTQKLAKLGPFLPPPQPPGVRTCSFRAQLPPWMMGPAGYTQGSHPVMQRLVPHQETFIYSPDTLEGLLKDEMSAGHP